MVDLCTKLASLQMKNPMMLASGIMDEDAGSIQRIIDSNAGAIVTKSIGLYPREGYPNPTLIEVEDGLLNAMGLPNPGINNYRREMDQLRKSKTPIIGSIYGASSDEFAQLGQQMEDYGAAALELNLSCPHAKKYGLEVGCNPKLAYEITSSVKDTVRIPVFPKLSPNVTDIVEIAQAVEKAGADAIVAINTVKAMKIDVDIGQPVLSNKIGGYSGKAIKPIGIRCVYEIAENANIPIIGVGGITRGEDAVEYIMAGASAVQIGSAVYYRDVDVFTKICTEIERWMQQHNYKKISELVGVAH